MRTYTFLVIDPAGFEEQISVNADSLREAEEILRKGAPALMDAFLLC